MNLINKNDCIFIAGNKGMVGSAIQRAMIANGYLNLLTPSRNELDLLDYNSVKKWFQKNKPDIVILAAAKVGGIQANFKYPGEFILENLKIQTNVIENAWKNNIKRFIFLGSSCIYPKFATQPLKEEYLLTGPLEITNESYAIAKIAGIKLCNSLKIQYGFDAISLMPTNLFGPKDNYHKENSHVMPSLIRKFHNAKLKNEPYVVCWGSGTPKREFLYVDDLAEACIFTLENISSNDDLFYDEESKFNGVLNIGTGKDITIKELAEIVSIETDYKGEIQWDLSKPDGTPRKILDVSKAYKLGWSAKTDIKEGVRLTFESFKKELKDNILRT